jgi:hypothetical protein
LGYKALIFLNYSAEFWSGSRKTRDERNHWILLEKSAELGERAGKTR